MVVSETLISTGHGGIHIAGKDHQYSRWAPEGCTILVGTYLGCFYEDILKIDGVTNVASFSEGWNIVWLVEGTNAQCVADQIEEIISGSREA